MAAINSLTYLVYSILTLAANNKPAIDPPPPNAWEVGFEPPVTEAWSQEPDYVTSIYNADCPAGEKWSICNAGCPEDTCENRDTPKICPRTCVPGCVCEEPNVRGPKGCIPASQCPKPEKKTCKEEPDTGDCRAAFPMWYYDEKDGDCKKFIYGGCGGNGNRYKTKEECLKTCAKKTCKEEPETGLCHGRFPMWYYDDDTNDCKQFIYGGCGGNGNRYDTKEECLKTCAFIWEAGTYKCTLPPETGLCEAHIPRYYFDKDARECKQFIYGGCGGNENNFKSEEECKSECANQAEQICGEHEIFTECGTACPLTCENYEHPPGICPAVCTIGCQCEKGFVRRADGKCVETDQCSK